VLPELPEVETIKRTLARKVIGRKIVEVNVFLPKIVKSLEVDEFVEKIKGSIIEDINRRGKYLLIMLDRDYTLIVNLRMTGQLVFVPEGEDLPLAKHTHVIFELEGGCQIRFRDSRKFGTMHLVPTIGLEYAPEIKNLGPEPLEPGFTEQKLRKLLIGRRKKIKQLLTDQSFIAGIGNIYADEILFRAGIHPERVSNALTTEEIHSLYLSIVAVLNEAVYQRGTSIRDYIDGEGHSGNYQKMLQVYGRKGELCYHCDCEIASVKLGGRTAHFCPGCQK